MTALFEHHMATTFHVVKWDMLSFLFKIQPFSYCVFLNVLSIFIRSIVLRL